MISIATLIGAGIAPTQARLWAGPLAAAALRFGIDRPVREAAWVSQCAHESGNFIHLEENLFYTTAERVRAMFPSRVPSLDVAATLLRNPKALANRVYANKNGNGDESSGDGWAYRGRGLIQLTGRANYLAAAAALDQPYKTQPDLVSQPLHAAMTAAWFFVSANGLVLADASNIDALTRAINGPAMAGRDDRRQRFEQAVRAFA
ncbi:glycoside hydrolase family 19 protein [Roseateles sp. DC23W]|uniref:Glycoside hydrolase family 19 protein n=1 Tax=Pelomonas dachongensis TaxID=3299029 RepID=A0ABW7EK21_9BURK